MKAKHWTSRTIDELKAKSGTAIAIGPFGSRMKSDCYVTSGVPVIRGNNISDTRELLGEMVYITSEKAEEVRSSILKPDDLFFPHRGAIGLVGIVPNNRADRYVQSTSLMKLTCDRTQVEPLFLFYFFRSPQGRHELLKNASTVGTPGIGQPLSSLKSIRVPYPPLSEQKAIAKVLSALDDKIELNRRMNETLEVLAQHLFKSWFMDATQGGLPNGWRIDSLDKIAHFLNGLALQKFPPDGENSLPVIKIAQLRAGNTNGADWAGSNVPSEYVIEDGDVLFSWSGSLEVELWCGGRGALNQHLFKVISANFPKWFYFLWTRYHLPAFRAIAAGKATTMGHIQRRHLSEADVFIPTDAELEKMNSQMSPIIERIIANNLESRTLAALRDALLPKLLSGEVRASSAGANN